MFGATRPDNWQSNYNSLLNEGLEYQDHVSGVLLRYGLIVNAFSSQKYQLKGEGWGGIEIKYDRRFHETQNLYIEMSEKRDPSNIKYFPSGISKNDNTWLYVIGDYSTIFLFSKRQLYALRHNFKQVQTPTSNGYLLPLASAQKWALKIIEL